MLTTPQGDRSFHREDQVIMTHIPNTQTGFEHLFSLLETEIL